MQKSYFIKAFILLSFISLITLFLLYRTGKFDKYVLNERSELQSSPNGGFIPSNKKDTTKSKNYFADKLRLSSSKFIILSDKTPSFLDSAKKRIKLPYIQPPNEQMMSSSKSAIIFTPITFKPLKSIRFLIDSLNNDTTKNKKINQQ